MPENADFLPDSKTVKHLDSLLKSHPGLTAWEVVKELPPLQNWQGFEGKGIAGRLASALGNSQLGYVIDRSNWRENPKNHRAYFRALFCRLRYKASSLLLPEIQERLKSVEPGSEIYSDILGLIASCQASVREFKKAHLSLDEAMKNCEDPSWLWVQRSITYEQEDRYEEALESILEGKKIKPWYRPVVEIHSRALINLNRDQEAQEALIESSKHTDTSAVPLKLSVIFSELDDTTQTSHWLDEYERKSPLLDRHSKKWLAGRRADLCYLNDDFEGFLKHSQETAKKSFHRRCLKFYKNNNGAKGSRKKLEVDFVRQHNMTCAPATISALTAFFNKTHDHLKIAEAICYDGTPWHKERTWCEEHGFHVCEFPITMEAAKSLIDANIPFSLTTQSIDSGHLQACIGYDDKLGLLLLRDPTLRHYGEAILSGLQKDHPVFGLRGLAFVPIEMKEKLEQLELPGQLPYDLYHQLSCAFDDHDEDAIETVMETFRSEAPDSPLRFHSEARLASRNGHPAVELEFNEKLIKLFPKHQSLWLQKIRILERLSRHTEARDFLTEIHRKPESDPFFDMEVGELLCRDIRSIELGQFYLRRALRQRPSSAQAHATYATSLIVLDQREEALRFRRSATRLNPSFEPYARNYYNEAKYLHREKEEEALQYLHERADKVGDLDTAPHLTLLKIFSGNNDPRTPSLAEELLTRFPSDGDLLLETVTLFSGWNRHEEAQLHLEQAKNKVPRHTWLNVAARYWSWTGDRQKSRKHWEQLIQLRPLNTTAYESVARHLAEEQDRDAAVTFMEKAHQAQPDYLPLLKSYIEWIEFYGPSTSIPLLEKAISLDPLDLWAIRELALELSKNGDHARAEAQAEKALSYDPSDEGSHTVLGIVQEAAQKKNQATASFREALKLNIDHTAAFNGLTRVSETFAARKEALEFVRGEMIRQVSNGDIIPEYRLQASGVVEPTELEHDLKTFHQERPDLWEAWNALRDHYHTTSQHDLELEIAEKMTQHFPLLPRAWAELAFALRAQGKTHEEVAAFEKALDLSPSWDWILRELSQSLENLERYDDALVILDRAIDCEPLAPGGYGYKADLLWKIGRRSEAIAEIKRALKVAPLYQWGWSKLIAWTKREKREKEVTTLISELEEKRKHQWRWWMCLAEVYSDLDQGEEALAAVEKGLTHEPLELSLLDLKATLLAELGRYPESIATCQTPFDDGKQPIRLQGREAWVLMESGRRKDAWDRIQALSESEPDYTFAHSLLASWSFDTESWEALKKASQRLIALNPDDSENWGYLGQAEEKLKKPEAALEAYARALRASPSYIFAARQKAALELEQGQLDESEATLTRIQHHRQSSYLIADQLAIDLRRCNRELNDTIRNRWEELASISSELDQDPYYYTDSIFEEAKLSGLHDLLLSERAATQTLASADEARAWGRRIRASKKRKKLLKDTLNSPLKEELKASVISAVIRGKEPPQKEVEKLISTNSSLINKYHDSWDAAVNFYVRKDDAVKACLYGDQWRKFLPQIQPERLVGYATLVDDARGIEEGNKVRCEILEKFPQWEGTKLIRVCVAFHHAIAGNTEAANSLIAGYEDAHTPQNFYDSVYQHTLANLSAHNGDAASCERHFRAAAHNIRDFPEDPAALGYLRASANSCAQTLGIFKGRGKTVLRKWAKGLGKSKSKIPWWAIALIIWIILKVIGNASK